MSAGYWWRLALRRLDDYDLRSRLRRLARNRPRRVFAAVAVFLFFIYLIWPSSIASDAVSGARACVNDQLRQWSSLIDEVSMGTGKDSVDFVGNGHLGVGKENELRLAASGSRVLSTSAGFRPLVDTFIPESSDYADVTLTDFAGGAVKRVRCYLVNGECACTIHTIYAHRTRLNLLVQDIKIINPTKNSVEVKLSRPESPDWKAERHVGDTSVLSRSIVGEGVAAAMCSSIPTKLTVHQKREESLRFTCVLEQRAVGKANEETIKGELVAHVVKVYSDVKQKGVVIIDTEHTDAWQKLNSVSFHLSHSKMNEVLNGGQINATRYVIVSNVKAPIAERHVPMEMKKNVSMNIVRSELCYTGHSTLLYPSRLWQELKTSTDMVRLADLWLLTLEKRGCAHLLKAGAHGVVQAIVLSLAAGTFHGAHLEIGLDPEDMHRETRVRGLAMGNASQQTLAFDVLIDTSNRPYLHVWSSEGGLFACDAGCLDEPIALTRQSTYIPVKLTKPLTSILYVGASRTHLEDLRSAIHVSEVGAAPAHEDDVLEGHRNGESGGLPSWVWWILGTLLVAFHVGLFKILYTEWRKGDTTPYNPYLRNRYSILKR